MAWNLYRFIGPGPAAATFVDRPLPRGRPFTLVICRTTHSLGAFEMTAANLPGEASLVMRASRDWRVSVWAADIRSSPACGKVWRLARHRPTARAAAGSDKDIVAR